MLAPKPRPLALNAPPMASKADLDDASAKPVPLHIGQSNTVVAIAKPSAAMSNLFPQARLTYTINVYHPLLRTKVVTPEGIEPSTSDLEGPCSIQLSYGATRAFSGRANPHARGRVMKIDIGSRT